MAKMASIAGAVVGKIGGNVYSVNSGQQIVRAYQPNVANPSTDLQVASRAKLKLASQLAAAFSPVIAIRRNGMVSGRNQFISDAMNYMTVSDGQANVQLSKLQLTKSGIMLPALLVSVSQENKYHVRLDGDATELGIQKVVYARFVATDVNKLLLRTSMVSSAPGTGGHFGVDLGDVENLPSFIYAYGIIEDDSNTFAKYQDYQINSASFIASLISDRSGASSSLKTTTTSYAYRNAQNNSAAANDPAVSSSRKSASGK